MSDAKGRTAAQAAAGRFLGSLKDALHAAGNPAASEMIEIGNATVRTTNEKPADAVAAPEPTDTGRPQPTMAAPEPAPNSVVTPEHPPAAETAQQTIPSATQAPRPAAPHVPSAAEAVREARGGHTPRQTHQDAHLEFDGAMTRIVKPGQNGVDPNLSGQNSAGKIASPSTGSEASASPALALDDSSRTQVLRGRQPVARGEFRQDPVVGWLVVVGGKGLGNFRPIFEGNNSIGRASSNRIPIDFGDDAISSQEQAYIRYDSSDRSFLLVPNLAKTNVVALNDKRPTAAVPISTMDVITMGRTQLVFVSFCGPDFDWSELGELGG